MKILIHLRQRRQLYLRCRADRVKLLPFPLPFSFLSCTTICWCSHYGLMQKKKLFEKQRPTGFQLSNSGGGEIFHFSGCVSLMQFSVTWTACLFPDLLQFLVKRFTWQNKHVLITLYPFWQIKSMPVSLTVVGGWTWTTADLFLHSQWIESPWPEVMLTEMELCLQQA